MQEGSQASTVSPSKSKDAHRIQHPVNTICIATDRGFQGLEKNFSHSQSFHLKLA